MTTRFGVGEATTGQGGATGVEEHGGIGVLAGCQGLERAQRVLVPVDVEVQSAEKTQNLRWQVVAPDEWLEDRDGVFGSAGAVELGGPPSRLRDRVDRLRILSREWHGRRQA